MARTLNVCVNINVDVTPDWQTSWALIKAYKLNSAVREPFAGRATIYRRRPSALAILFVSRVNFSRPRGRGSN